MTIHPEDLKFAQDSLWPQETVMVTGTQRRAGPGMNPVNPTTVIATDRRILIIKRATFGLRKDIETIPYDRIMSVRMEKGFWSASVYIRVSGYSSAGEAGFMGANEQEGEIDGMYKNDAKAISEYINKIISGMQAPDQAPEVEAPQAKDFVKNIGNNPDPHPIYCSKCGSKNSASAVFCEECGAKIKRTV